MLDSGVPLPAHASADIPGGSKVHNDNIEQVESMSLGYTTLSAINLKATANDSNMASDQPGSHHSSRLYQDLLEVDANINPVSGLNDPNQILRRARSACKGPSGGNRDEEPQVGDTDSDLQTLGPRCSVISHDSLIEGDKFSSFDDFSTSFANNPKYQNNRNGKFDALDVKFEEASQAAASKVCSSSNIKSFEEIQSLIKNEFWNIFNRDGTRKRGSTDASLTDPAISKRKMVACGFCPKKMLRECDLKYKSSFRVVNRSAKGETESIRNVIRVHMAAPSKAASRPLAVKMTGNDTKTRSIIRSKHGGVMNQAPTRSSSAPRCFTGESNSSLTSRIRMGIISTMKITFASNSKDIRSEEMGRRHFGVDFARRLSSCTNRDSTLGTRGSIILITTISNKATESRIGTS